MIELIIVYKSMPPSSHIQTTAGNIGHDHKYSKKIIRKRISRNTGRDDMLFGNTCFSLS